MKFWRRNLHIWRLNVSLVRNDALVACCNGTLSRVSFSPIYFDSFRGFVFTIHVGNYFLNIDWV